jgi:spore germination protein YaaH
MPPRPARLRAVLLTFVLSLTAALLVTPAAQAAEPAPSVSSARKVTAWLPHWDQARAMESFTANADLYAYASPFWYAMTTTGGIARYSGAEDAAVLSGIRGAGVKVVPTLTNAFDPVRTSAVLGSDSARAAHVQAILDLVLSRSYDGIDIDYEAMAGADRDRFSTFLRELSAGLRAHGRLLTVAVHAKTSDTGTWSGPQAHDYAAIGAVADRVRVMAYDHSWSTSPAGPIAPLSWVDRVAAYAASRVHPTKVELGMHLYGYDWVGSKGEGITYATAAARASSTGAPRVWDATAAEPSFSYTAADGPHTVYYADAQSVSARLEVVDRHGLAGAAFWRLGGEDPSLWNAVRSRWGAAPAAVSPAPAAPAADTVAPSAPASLAATAGRRRVALSWSASTDTGGSGLSGYRVLRATSSAGPWTQLASTSGTSWDDEGLQRGRTYWYVVRAVDGAGNLSASSTAVGAVAR